MSTAVILAGGMSRRMQRDKLALPFGASSLLASAVGRFSTCFDAVYLSVADARKYPEIDAERVVDVYKGCGPMAGLHAALLRTEEDGVFLVAADLPYAAPRAALEIIRLCGDRDACVVAGSRSGYEPLFGYYRKSILPIVEEALASGEYKLAAILDKLRLRLVRPEELGDLWQETMLMNVNYPADYEQLTGGAPPPEGGERP